MMNYKKTLAVMALSGAVVGLAQAADNNVVSKKITLTAQINDSMFVSKPDGSTWYATEMLEAVDYKQKKFTKTLPIRVWSKSSEFNISLAQPLKLSNGPYEMSNATVSLGEDLVTYGAQKKVTQTLKGADGYSQLYNLSVNVDAPTETGGRSTNGSYSGDLVMLFEPVAAVDE